MVSAATNYTYSRQGRQGRRGRGSHNLRQRHPRLVCRVHIVVALRRPVGRSLARSPTRPARRRRNTNIVHISLSPSLPLSLPPFLRSSASVRCVLQPRVGRFKKSLIRSRMRTLRRERRFVGREGFGWEHFSSESASKKRGAALGSCESG